MFQPFPVTTDYFAADRAYGRFVRLHDPESNPIEL
jgi:hypothetical protein